MDGDVQYNEMGGGECTDAQENFQAGCSVSPPLRLGGMDGDLPRLQDYGKFPEKGGPQADGEAASGLTPPGGGNDRFQFGRGGNIHHTEEEHGRAINFETADSGPMRGGRTMDMDAGIKVVVGEGEGEIGRSMGSYGNKEVQGGGGGRGGVGTGELSLGNNLATK